MSPPRQSSVDDPYPIDPVKEGDQSYRDADGTVRTTSERYRTKKEATEASEELDTDQRRGQLIDPAARKTLLREWASRWEVGHAVSVGTGDRYEYLLRLHILPAFGDHSLEGIGRMAVKQWAAGLTKNYAPSTVGRRVDLPPFLITLLEEVLAKHDHAQVFASTEESGTADPTSPDESGVPQSTATPDSSPSRPGRPSTVCVTCTNQS